MRVAPARVRQHEEARAVHGCLLEARLDQWCLRMTEDLPQRSVHRHTHEGHNLRAESIDFLLEDLPTIQVLLRLQHVDAGTRPRDQVRHADAPLRQPIVVQVRQRLRDDA
jgi:hypothetical protein